MPRERDVTRALFDRWAESYATDTANPSGPLLGYNESLETVDEMVALSPEAKLLDIGIGTGSLAALFAERLEDTRFHSRVLEISQSCH